MNVLWGRVVVLGVVLIMVFFLGRATGGNSAELKTLQDRLSDREAEIDQLEAANREAAEATPTPDPGAGTQTGTETGTETGSGTAATPGTTITPTPTVSASPSPAAGNTEAQNYVVKSGDNLGRISSRFYGTAGLVKCIQAANPSITDASKLRVGQSIVIPAEATCT